MYIHHSYQCMYVSMIEGIYGILTVLGIDN